jgi:hypothetical protein
MTANLAAVEMQPRKADSRPKLISALSFSMISAGSLWHGSMAADGGYIIPV